MKRLWTVYVRPDDYPASVVARLEELDHTGMRPTGSIIIAPDLKTLREILEFELKLVCLARNPCDDPQIIETWLTP